MKKLIGKVLPYILSFYNFTWTRTYYFLQYAILKNYYIGILVMGYGTLVWGSFSSSTAISQCFTKITRMEINLHVNGFLDNI